VGAQQGANLPARQIEATERAGQSFAFGDTLVSSHE
jgi:hypothetical protein